MITKNASSYIIGNDVFTPRNVKGFRSAILTIIVAEGESFSVGAWISYDGSTPGINTVAPKIYKDNVSKTGNITFDTAGVYTFVMDFDGATNLRLSKSGTITNSVVCLNLKQERYENLMGALNSIELKGVDSFSEYSFGGWKDVSRYNSAKLIITGLSGSIMLSGLANPNPDKPEALNMVAPLYCGTLSVDRASSTVNVLDIDVAGMSALKVSATGTLDGVTAYLLLSDNTLRLSPKKCTYVSAIFNVGVAKADSVMVDVTVDGITSGQNVSGINIKDKDNNAVSFLTNGVLVNGVVNVTDAGTYRLYVDCRELDSLAFNITNTTGISISVTPSDAVVEYKEDYLISIPKSFVFEGKKQIEVEVDAAADDRIYIEGSNDDFATSSNISYLKCETGARVGSYTVLPAGKSSYYANVEGYKKVRVRFTRKSNGVYRYGEALTKVNIVAYDKYKEGLTLPFWGNTATAFAKGYRYAKVRFFESAYNNGQLITGNVKDCMPVFNFNNITAAKSYDLGMVPLTKEHLDSDGAGGFNYGRIVLFGAPVGGGCVIEFTEPISVDTRPVVSATKTVTGYACSVPFIIEYYTRRPEPEDAGLVKLYDKEGYSIYRLPSESTNRDVLNKDLLEWTDNSLTFWHGGFLGFKYSIPFGADNVRNYVTDETIQFAYLLPYVGYRNRSGSVGSLLNQSRIVVFTKSRIYHNFPKRATDTGTDIRTSDAALFDESSVITDKKWLPVNDKNLADSKHKYLPVLAEYDYDQFDGRIAGTTGFVDEFSNGGLVVPNGKLPLDLPIEGATYWHRLAYSNMAKGEKWCVWGNYSLYEGSEAIAIATNDGGRTWYAKVYFAATDYYNYMFGSKIDLKPITDVAAYVSGSLKMCRRRFNVPTPEAKEPSVPFVIESEEQSLVTGFSVDADGDCLVTLADNVDYDGKYPVVYFENVSANSEWDYICNTGFTADGTTTNSGIFFRVKKVTANTYKLFANLGDPYGGDAVCRHIHAVNAVESGFLISTGESYAEDWFEGGFIYHLVQNRKNGGDAISPSGAAEVIRLCSSYMGVNRACGAYLFSDHADPTLLYVSDEAFTVSGASVQTEKRYASIDGRTVKVPITPAGIYVGKLSEIDDQAKYDCVCELHTTIVGLLQTHGHFAAEGHSNAIMFSKDGFKWEIDVNDGSEINGFDNQGNIYFGNKVAVFK